ncbi:hypothetical protein [Leifsonia sp. 71-9]|uniref:hypothetical protein n=1 Tax=Leifsonia sp. 71-9 TaxID=1895934 RepID=UPI0025B9576B|nr:hypothetical protein [Leifsonia sp. 71-9]
MAPIWTSSTAKHGVPRHDAQYALLHPNYVRDLEHNDDGTVNRLFIGPAHAQTTRELEVIVRIAIDGSGREAVVFHVMQLGPKFRRLREENPR